MTELEEIMWPNGAPVERPIGLKPGILFPHQPSIQPTKLKFKKLHPDAVVPHYASPGAACFDLTAIDKIRASLGNTYFTGLAFEIPHGHVGLLFPRSSVSKTYQMLANSVGVIDSDYRGEVILKFHKLGSGDYDVGDRVGQMMIVPIPIITLEEVEELGDTDRGSGGFGSTGS